ncbi:MAG: polysaccharide deacetylase family protein [Actinobacteria bacterium]|nr:polysaccharide deacetylase family protein [Actinomycetota bacterium]
MTLSRRILRIARNTALALVAMTVVPVAHQAFMGMPVTVNGDSVTVARGAVVRDALDGLPDVESGHVLSAVTRHVMHGAIGHAPRLAVNGREATLTTVVHVGDRITAASGVDTVEPLVDETRTVDPVPRTIGAGTVPKVVSAGTPSVYVLRVGAVSGEVAATETVSVGVPAVVRMVPAPGVPLVALTFDDGPWPGQTEAVLSILEQRNVPATFFMLGMCVERAPDLARAVAAAGHLVGNHTYWHVNLARVGPDVAAWEIEATNAAILQATGVRPAWFRAPGGSLGGPAHSYITQWGMRSALWNVDPQDWREGMMPQDMAWSVISVAQPNAVIVLHDGGGDQSATIAALPYIIDGLRAYGYEFVTLDELPDVRAGW